MIVKKLIFHCSDSRWGNAATITEWHLGRGWKTIGYHYLILNGWISSGFFDERFDGNIETGRPRNIQGAHVKGHNVDTLGICLIGNSGLFTNKQLESARNLIIYLQGIYGDLKVKQHSQYDDSKPYCAGLDLKEIMP